MGTAIPNTLPSVLHERESMLLWPDAHVSDEELELLLAEDFHEIGASGKRFDRSFGIRTLRERRAHPDQKQWTRSDEHMHELQPALVLMTYRLERGDRTSMRSTLWRRNLHGVWQAVFHQGTPVGE